MTRSPARSLALAALVTLAVALALARPAAAAPGSTLTPGGGPGLVARAASWLASLGTLVGLPTLDRIAAEEGLWIDPNGAPGQGPSSNGAADAEEGHDIDPDGADAEEGHMIDPDG